MAYIRLSSATTIAIVSLQGRTVLIGDSQPVDRRPGLPSFGTDSNRFGDWELQFLGERIQRAGWGISLQRLAFGLSAQVPYWFLVLLTGILAAAPWIKYRFSLRTLLIVTTLVAVVLGVIAASAP